MRMLLAVIATATMAYAQTTVVPYQSTTAQPSTVISPLTNPTAQQNQALLNQINGTMQQRYLQHQILTTQPVPAAVVSPIIVRPR